MGWKNNTDFVIENKLYLGKLVRVRISLKRSPSDPNFIILV